jgi:hypothetical protein
MNFLYLVFGVVLLVAGRRLYWLFVAAVGFWAGSVLAHEHFAERAREWAMLVGVIGGILGALLAVLFQKLAVALAGAAAGGFFGWTLLERIGWESWGWIGLVIGAIVGGILVLKLFDWGLIIVSSLAGAGLLIDGIELEKSAEGLLLVAAFIVGVAVQGTHLARRTPPTKEERREGD